MLSIPWHELVLRWQELVLKHQSHDVIYRLLGDGNKSPSKVPLESLFYTMISRCLRCKLSFNFSDSMTWTYVFSQGPRYAYCPKVNSHSANDLVSGIIFSPKSLL